MNVNVDVKDPVSVKKPIRAGRRRTVVDDATLKAVAEEIMEKYLDAFEELAK